MAVLEEQPLGGGASFRKRCAQVLSHGGAQLARAPGMQLRQLFELGHDHRDVEQFGEAARCIVGRGEHSVTGIAEPARHVTVGKARQGGNVRIWTLGCAAVAKKIFQYRC